MSETQSSLDRLIAEMRRLTAETGDPGVIVNALRPVMLEAARAKDWLKDDHYRCDPEQGFGTHLLHEEADHGLAVLAVAWMPGSRVLPHDHGTWAVIGGVDGAEHNYYWRRFDDRSRAGYAEVREVGGEEIGPGEVLTMLPDAIHSVANETGQVTLSLHAYGRHPNHTERSQYDPEARTAQPYQFTQESVPD
jgi:predicted metal-dependent enzyme (double-stranded beta helix superfamily)